jgi:hypothetical protein
MYLKNSQFVVPVFYIYEILGVITVISKASRSNALKQCLHNLFHYNPCSLNDLLDFTTIIL